MKILKLASYYEPEKISSSHLSKDLEEAYLAAGFDISVYAPTPTRGISKEVYQKYKNIKYQEKSDGKIKIERFSMFRERKSIVLRAVRYISVNIIQYFKAIKNPGSDIIISGSTPPTQGVLISLVKKKLKIPAIYILQDMFPDSLLHTGLATRNSFLYKFGKMLETYTYKNMDKIIVISDDFKRNLISKGVDKNKIKVVYNWVDTQEVQPITKKNNLLFDKLNLDTEMFYVVYAGNLGFAQNIDIILKVARELSEFIDMRFLIFGSGAQEKYYKEKAKEMKLTNVIFFPLQSPNLISEVYSLGNVSIVSCKAGIGKSAMPSKTWSIMSAGTALVASYDEDTDLHNIIKNNDIGLFAKSGDVEELNSSVLRLYKDRELCRKIGLKGRNFVKKNMDKIVATNKYIDIINEELIKVK